MQRFSCLAVLVLLLSGCSQYGYPYHPASQPTLSPVFADYRERGEVVDILVDTHGRRLESGHIVTSEGIQVQPTSIDQPRFEAEIIGGMAGWKDPRYGVERAQGPTVLHFDRQKIGNKPWQVELTIQGIRPVSMSVGG